MVQALQLTSKLLYGIMERISLVDFRNPEVQNAPRFAVFTSKLTFSLLI